MAIYVYTPDSDTYDSLSLPSGRAYDVVNQLLGTPTVETWRPIRVQVHKGEKRGDFPSLIGHLPVFSERALSALRPLIENEVEVLSLKGSTTPLYAIHILDLVDCLDEAKSGVKRFPGGGIMHVDRPVFRDGCVDGKHIFKIRDAPLKDVYVSEEFKRRAEEAGLEGVVFRQAT